MEKHMQLIVEQWDMMYKMQWLRKKGDILKNGKRVF